MKPFLFLFICLSFQTSVAQEITEQNWLTHPKIKAIRVIFTEIEDAIAESQLEVLKYTYEYNEPYEDTERAYFRDENGIIRKFVRGGGSGDSAMERSYYYDQQGKLVFMFAKGGAVNGTTIEHRIYFEGAKRIWEKRKRLTGPGWGFPNPWQEWDIVYSPTDLLKQDKERN